MRSRNFKESIKDEYLCADIGYVIIGGTVRDHVDVFSRNAETSVIVLADGLGSGVRRATFALTSKNYQTMLSEGIELEDCVETIA